MFWGQECTNDTSFILLVKQAEWSYMTDKIPCSSGISLLPQGIYLCYKPLFDCWNSPQVTVLRSVRNSGFRASMSRGKKRHFQVSLRKETNTLKRTEHTNTLHCRKKAFTERLPVMIEISLFQLKIRNTRLHIWEICVTTQQIWSLG